MTEEDHKIWDLVARSIRERNTHAYVARPIYARSLRSSIDLHGYTIAQAHALVRDFVQHAFHHGMKSVTIITGMSGGIKKEFPFWVELMPQINRITPVNGGSFKIHLNKK